MPEPVDFAVIGGGAAGLAAAVSAAEYGDRVLLIEKNNALGRKISASGNGRCNLMNNGRMKYYGNARFAQKVLASCSKDRLISFWKNLGIWLSEENEGRMYPCTFQSTTIINAYKTRLKTSKVEILLQTSVLGLEKNRNFFVIRSGEETLLSKRVLIACGGIASPKLGGTDSGYQLLAGFGHTILPVKPALCPLTTDSKSISGLSGIRVKCRSILKSAEGKIIQEEKGEILFTNYGISGICIMQMARLAEIGMKIELDLTGRVFPMMNELESFLLEYRKSIQDFSPETILNGILVPKLSYAVLKQAGIEVKNRKVGDLSVNEIRQIAQTSRRYSLTVTGNRGMDEAQVTAGGADCEEFDPVTLQSKVVCGLHAAGETLDVDGDCGGYNLMFATASGMLAGINGREGT